MGKARPSFWFQDSDMQLHAETSSPSQQEVSFPPQVGQSSYYGSRAAAAAADLLERVLYMALMVFGVVLQQPPTRDAPSSHHLSTYETKSSSETPVFCCNKNTAEAVLVQDHTIKRSSMYL